MLNRYIPYPLQYHLSYLPAPLRNAALGEILTGRKGRPDNLRDYVEHHFGSTLFSLFFKPFLSKYYGTALADLAADVDKGSIPIPDEKSAAAGARGKRFSQTGYNPVFYYPENSLGNFIETYAADIQKNRRIKLNEEVVEINIDKKKVKTKNNTYEYKTLINTMPLKQLLKAIKQADRFPCHGKLRHTSTLVANIVLKKRRKRLHWVYLPEAQFPFYRAGYYPYRGITVSYLEKTTAPGEAVNRDILFAEILFTLKKLEFIESKDEILYFDTPLIPVSYILFDREWHKVVPPTLTKLKKYDIHSTGRYGAWNYTSMSDDIKSAIETVKAPGFLF
jgi:protoporphyrinogen oxidase